MGIKFHASKLKLKRKESKEAHFAWKALEIHQFSHQIDIEDGRQKRDLRDKETHEFVGRRRQWIVFLSAKKRGLVWLLKRGGYN